MTPNCRATTLYHVAMFPCPGEVYLGYETTFVFAEINSDRVTWIVNKNKEVLRKYCLIKSRVIRENFYWALVDLPEAAHGLFNPFGGPHPSRDRSNDDYVKRISFPPVAALPGTGLCREGHVLLTFRSLSPFWMSSLSILQGSVDDTPKP